MNKHCKLFALVWLGALAILLPMEVSQFNKIQRLRSQIAQSYELISGRDEGIRLELDFRRFRAKLESYIKSDSLNFEERRATGHTHKQVMMWFDLVRRRVAAIDNKEIAQIYVRRRPSTELISELQQTLNEIGPLVQALQPGRYSTYITIRNRLEMYERPITEAATLIAQSRLGKAANLQHKLDTALNSMNAMFYTTGAGVALILAFFGFEAYRARRDERMTRHREARVRYLAEHDPLTGLGNRSFLNEKMAQFIRAADEQGTSFHLLLLDLDKFKDVNDTFGHPVGDRLLRKVAARLLRIFNRPDDIVVRLGGDEFAMLVKSDLSAAAKSAQDVIDALITVFELQNFEIRVATSIGISSYPALSNSVDDLMRDADLALYEAKNKGGQTFMIYEKEMSIALQHRVMLEADLRRAIASEDGGLEVYYQPQVRLCDWESHREITGVEALVRWFHPEHGQISPMEFIEIAETSGIIDELTDWIVRQACADVVTWHKAGFMINLSVNLSPVQLNNPNLPSELLAHLESSGFDPHYLTLEITESMDVQDTAAAARMLGQLTAKGISLAMDDFGTGYSNLGYLNSLPLDTLKIDRSFVMQIVDNEEERKLVRGIINLAQGLDLKVVAEGIETEEQFALLKGKNCDYGQGYLFGRPMHKLALLAMLSEQYLREQNFEAAI